MFSTSSCEGLPLLCTSANAAPSLDTPAREHMSSLLMPLFFAGVPLFLGSTPSIFFSLCDLRKYFSSSSHLSESTTPSRKDMSLPIILCLQLHAVEWHTPNFSALSSSVFPSRVSSMKILQADMSNKEEYEGFPISSTNLLLFLAHIYLLSAFCLSSLGNLGMIHTHLGHTWKLSAVVSLLSSLNFSTSETTCFFWNLVSFFYV